MTVGQVVTIEVFSAEDPAAAWMTGPKFRQELQRPFSGSWTSAEFRQILVEVSSDRRISIVLDRRLNPTVEFPFASKNVSLQAGLTDVARLAKGEISVAGNLVYVGPDSAAKALRTLIELRKNELSQSKEIRISDQRRAELQRHRTIEWRDLDAPREILAQISDQFQFRISNAELIPHDLWAATVLPEVSLPEALSIVLIQFELTFRWNDAGTSIELVSIPEKLSVERKHRSKMKPSAAIAAIHERFPEIETKASSGEIIVRGLVEDHEAVASLLRGDGPAPPVRQAVPQPIRKRLFTFSAEQPVPLIDLMKKLEESDIRFEYSADELKAAGIDLEQTVQPVVTKMPGEDFLNTIFGPTRLDFQIDGLTVKLKPKRATSPNK